MLIDRFELFPGMWVEPTDRKATPDIRIFHAYSHEIRNLRVLTDLSKDEVRLLDLRLLAKRLTEKVAEATQGQFRIRYVEFLDTGTFPPRMVDFNQTLDGDV